MDDLIGAVVGETMLAHIAELDAELRRQHMAQADQLSRGDKFAVLDRAWLVQLEEKFGGSHEEPFPLLFQRDVELDAFAQAPGRAGGAVDVALFQPGAALQHAQVHDQLLVKAHFLLHPAGNEGKAAAQLHAIGDPMVQGDPLQQLVVARPQAIADIDADPVIVVDLRDPAAGDPGLHRFVCGAGIAGQGDHGHEDHERGDPVAICAYRKHHGRSLSGSDKVWRSPRQLALAPMANPSASR